MKETQFFQPVVESRESPEGVNKKPSADLEVIKESIPHFTELDEGSQEFCVLVWQLSSVTRERFLDENPRVAEAIQGCRYFHEILESKPSNLKEFIKRLWIEHTSDTQMIPSYFEDRKIYLADMEELVRLHILELWDQKKSLGQGQLLYSRQTEYLAEKLLSRFRLMLQDTPICSKAGLPDAYRGVLDDLREGGVPSDTFQKLVLIHRLITSQHEYFRGSKSVAPAGQNIIQDMWRFCVVNMNDFSDLTPGVGRGTGPWNSAALSFFESLAQLDFKIRD